METYHLATDSQISQDCLRWQSYSICILEQWECSHDWLLGEGKNCYRQLVCGINQKTSYSYQRKLTWIVESRCAASSRQSTSPHFCYCHSCYLRLRLQTAESPAIFSRLGSIWLPCVPIFERFATWTNTWERWNWHSCHKWLVWTDRWKVLRWWRKSNWTSLGKMHCTRRGLCR